VRRRHEERAGGAVGLEVHPRDEVLAEEEGQNVVAEPPPVPGDVDLHAVAEAEEPLRARALEHERIERREERPRADTPQRRPGLARQVRLVRPALDARRAQAAVLDEAADERPRRRLVEAVVVGQVARGRHAQRPRGEEE
jgi:hypothetical protein